MPALFASLGATAEGTMGKASYRHFLALVAILFSSTMIYTKDALEILTCLDLYHNPRCSPCQWYDDLPEEKKNGKSRTEQAIPLRNCALSFEQKVALCTPCGDGLFEFTPPPTDAGRPRRSAAAAWASTTGTPSTAHPPSPVVAEGQALPPPHTGRNHKRPFSAGVAGIAGYHISGKRQGRKGRVQAN